MCDEVKCDEVKCDDVVEEFYAGPKLVSIKTTPIIEASLNLQQGSLHAFVCVLQYQALGQCKAGVSCDVK